MVVFNDVGYRFVGLDHFTGHSFVLGFREGLCLFDCSFQVEKLVHVVNFFSFLSFLGGLLCLGHVLRWLLVITKRTLGFGLSVDLDAADEGHQGSRGNLLHRYRTAGCYQHGNGKCFVVHLVFVNNNS